jgi:phage gp36-like protein
MSYCTEADLVKRFGTNELVRLTNIDDPSAASINLEVLNEAINDATAVINDFLVNYLPLPAIPARLPREACNIVRFYLYKDTPTDHVKEQFEYAIRYLKNIDLDSMGIGADDSGTPVIDTSDSVAIVQSQSAFSAGDMHGFVRDENIPFSFPKN